MPTGSLHRLVVALWDADTAKGFTCVCLPSLTGALVALLLS